MPRKFTTAKDAADLAKDLRTDLENQYAQTGRFTDIGGAEFQADLQSNLSGAGLAPPPPAATPFYRSWMQNLTSEKGMSAIGQGAGWASLAMAAGYSNIERLNQGQYVAPETMAAAQMQAVLPGMGVMAGTMIGTALGGPGGAYAGQLLGGSLGTMASATFGAGMERDKVARETSQELGTVIGAATAAIKKFAQDLQDTGAPLQDLQKTFNIIAQMGGGSMSTGAVKTQAGLSLALGDRYDPTIAGMASVFQRNPVLSQMRYEMTQSSITPQQAADMQVALSATGDEAGAAAFGNYAEAKTHNKQYDTDIAKYGDPRDESLAGSWTTASRTASTYWQALHLGGVKGWFRAYGGALESDKRLNANESPLLPGGDATNAARGAAATNATKNYHNLFGNQVATEGAADVARSDFSEVMVNGTKYSDFAKVETAARDALDDSKTSTRKMKEFVQGKIAGADPKVQPLLMLEANRLQRQELGLETESNQMAKATFGYYEDIQSSQFGYDQFSGEYSGKSAKSLRGLVTDRMDHLRNVAADQGLPMNDADRIAYLQQAKQLDIQSHQDIYRQEEGEIGVSSAKAFRRVTIASSYETPQNERKAQHEYRQTLTNQEAQLNRELKEGNLNYDQRLAKMKEIAQIGVAVTQNEVQSRRQFFSEQDTTFSAQFTGFTAGINRVIQRGGNAAVNVTNGTAILEKQIANAQTNLSQESRPDVRATIQAQIDSLNEQKSAFIQSTNTFSLNAKDQQSQTILDGEMYRAMKMPYMDSPNSNRFAIGNRELSQVNRDITTLNANRTTKKKAGGWHEEDESTYQEQLQGYLNKKTDVEYSERYELFNALPEMIAGSPIGGIGVSILPTQAMAAAFSPNPTVGAFGRRGIGHFDPSSLVTGYRSGSPLLLGTSPALEGGAAGAMSIAGGAGSTVDLLKRIADGQEKVVQAVQSLHQTARGRDESRPVQEMGAVVNSTLGNSFDAHRPGRAGL